MCLIKYLRSFLMSTDHLVLYLLSIPPNRTDATDTPKFREASFC